MKTPTASLAPAARKPGYHPVYGVDEILTRLAARWRIKGRLPLALDRAHWPLLVGEHLALHTSPLRISKGELLLAVDSPAWMNELQFRLPELLLRLKALLDKPKICSLRLTLAPLPFPSEPSGVKVSRVPEPLSVIEEAKIEELLAPLADEELRSAFRRAMRHQKRLAAELRRGV